MGYMRGMGIQCETENSKEQEKKSIPRMNRCVIAGMVNCSARMKITLDHDWYSVPQITLLTFRLRERSRSEITERHQISGARSYGSLILGPVLIE